MKLTRYQNKKTLHCGYTTGSCAAAAAKAAAIALLTGVPVETVTIDTPAQIPLTLTVEQLSFDKNHARCAVRKDGGDDPDITTGALVFADVTIRVECGVIIDGGAGVGRVTKPGLNQPVGAAAINSAPRKMILREVTKVCDNAGYSGGLTVIISIPGGAEIAKRTFNPKMGIEGGLSILGTSGIVEPMSDKAVIDTVKLELSVLAAAGQRSVVLTIGNYGGAFVKEVLGKSTDSVIKNSNFLGDAIDGAVECGFEKILIIGHIGKLVKLGIGMTNTHSSNGDGRIETLIACALRAGAKIEVLRALEPCVTTDAALEVLRRHGLLDAAMTQLGKKIDETLRRRVPDSVGTGFICFSGDEILVRSGNAGEEKWYTL